MFRETVTNFLKVTDKSTLLCSLCWNTAKNIHGYVKINIICLLTSIVFSISFENLANKNYIYTYKKLNTMLILFKSILVRMIMSSSSSAAVFDRPLLKNGVFSLLYHASQTGWYRDHFKFFFFLQWCCPI